jgi:hypothetical protein
VTHHIPTATLEINQHSSLDRLNSTPQKKKKKQKKQYRIQKEMKKMDTQFWTPTKQR